MWEHNQTEAKKPPDVAIGNVASLTSQSSGRRSQWLDGSKTPRRSLFIVRSVLFSNCWEVAQWTGPSQTQEELAQSSLLCDSDGRGRRRALTICCCFHVKSTQIHEQREQTVLWKIIRGINTRPEHRRSVNLPLCPSAFTIKQIINQPLAQRRQSDAPFTYLSKEPTISYRTESEIFRKTCWKQFVAGDREERGRSTRSARGSSRPNIT